MWQSLWARMSLLRVNSRALFGPLATASEAYSVALGKNATVSETSATSLGDSSSRGAIPVHWEGS
ncbi:hypothetical protein [Burkholderia pyrrocinia]|uniref:hypothetical protein n=1 Tax=Burkholderia pyrrocinia TaxID=60550 RepID=UPI003D767B80